LRGSRKKISYLKTRKGKGIRPGEKKGLCQKKLNKKKNEHSSKKAKKKKKGVPAEGKKECGLKKRVSKTVWTGVGTFPKGKKHIILGKAKRGRGTAKSRREGGGNLSPEKAFGQNINGKTKKRRDL